MMLPAPEFVFTDGFPSVKGRRCACVSINYWADSEAAYELVSELKKNGTSSIPHIGGIWSVKVIDQHMIEVLMEMAGDFRWALECDTCSITNSSDANTDISEDINGPIDRIYGYEDMNDSDCDSEVAQIFPEDNCWKTVSADGEALMDMQMFNLTSPEGIPAGWKFDAPSPIPELPKLVRWSMNCAKDDCNLCIPIENNYKINDNTYTLIQ
jgi:hypothetical protein